MAYVVGGRLSMAKGRTRSRRRRGAWRASSGSSGCSRATKRCRRPASTPAKRCAWCAVTTKRSIATAGCRRRIRAHPGRRAPTWPPATAWCRPIAPPRRCRKCSGSGSCFRGSPEAADALNINTILYRLYVRAPGAPAFVFSGRFIGDERANFSDVVGVRVDRLTAACCSATRTASRSSTPKGALQSTVAAQRADGVLRRRIEPVVFAREGALHHRARRRRRRSRSRSRRRSRRVRSKRFPSVVALSTGSSPGGRTRRRRRVIRFGADGTLSRHLLPAINTERLAVNGAGRRGDPRQGCEGDHHRRSRRQAAVEDSRQGAELPVRRAGRPGVRSARPSLRARSRQGIGVGLRSEEQADHDLHDCREEPGRVHQGARARRSTRPAACTSSTSAPSAFRSINESAHHASSSAALVAWPCCSRVPAFGAERSAVERPGR